MWKLPLRTEQQQKNQKQTWFVPINQIVSCSYAKEKTKMSDG